MTEGTGRPDGDSPLQWNAERQQLELERASQFLQERVEVLVQSPGGDPVINPFQFLQVPLNASDQEVTEAFKKIVGRYPAEAITQQKNAVLYRIFNEIRRYALQARTVLLDSEKRKEIKRLVEQRFPVGVLEFHQEEDEEKKQQLRMCLSRLIQNNTCVEIKTDEELKSWLINLQQLADAGTTMHVSGIRVSWREIKAQVDELHGLIRTKTGQNQQSIQQLNRYFGMGNELIKAFSRVFSQASGDYSRSAKSRRGNTR